MTEAFYFLLGLLCGGLVTGTAFVALVVACYRWQQRQSDAPATTERAV